MSVLYDDNDNQNKRTYYVKLDNVTLPDNLKGYKAIEATTPQELLSIVIEYYKLDRAHIKVELWSTTKYNKGLRLDILNEIPKEYEFIWIRIVAK